MPYYGQFKSKKAYKKAKRYSRYYRNYRNAGQKALSMVNYIKKEMLNTENKLLTTTLDRTESQIAWDQTSSDKFICLNEVPVGTAYNQRVGNQIKLNSITCKFLLKGTSNAADSQRCRVVLFYDKMPDQSELNLSDLFESGSSASTVYSFKAIGVGHRFFIMYDRTFDIVGNRDNEKWTKIINIHRNLNKITKFDGTSNGDQNNMKSNRLYILFLSDVTNASDDGPSITGQSRLRYIDN